MNTNRLFLALALGSALTLGVLIFVNVQPLEAETRADIWLVRPPDVGCGPLLNCFTSLQEAVDTAGDGDEIRVATGVYTGVQARAGIIQVVYISRSLTLRGGYSLNFTATNPISYPTTVDAEGLGRGIVVSGPVTVTLEGLRITGGDATGLGGAPMGPGEYDAGGGLAVFSATVSLVSDVISGNLASTADAWTYCGGALLHGASGLISDTTFAHNLAATANYGEGGGACLFRSQDVTVQASRFLSNSVSSGNGGGDLGGMGGGLSVWSSTAVTIADSLFQGNRIRCPTCDGNGYGAGLSLWESSVVITDNQIVGNDATAQSGFHHGGGLYVYSSTATLNANHISGNVAGVGGGMLLDQAPNVTLEHNIVFSNTADNGGGLYLRCSNNATLRDNVLHANTSKWGGGGLCATFSDGIVLDGNTFTANTSTSTTGRGGGVYLWDSDGLVRGNTLNANRAHIGGGLAFYNGNLTLEGNTIISNTATGSHGGGLWLKGTAFTLTNNIIAANWAPWEGGGVWLGGTTTGEPPQARLVHNTLADNDGDGLAVGDNITVALTNTIAAGNTTAFRLAGSTACTLTADTTLFWDNPTGVTGTNSLAGDPAFVDATGLDYHILAASAARDAGVEAGVDDDIDGHRRPFGEIPDIGADEWLPDYAVLLAPDRTGWALARQPITYSHRLTNTGRLTDSYTLAAGISALGWAVEVTSQAVGPLSPGVGADIVVTVSVPLTALYQASAVALVTATSQAEPSVYAIVTDTTWVDCTPVTTVSIDYAPLQPQVSQPVWFTATANLNAGVVTFTWEFGDGILTTGQYATHVYTATGKYTVCLTGQNACGEAVISRTLSVAGHCVYLPLVVRNR
ncbi:MAG: right-handed parallel beta-helix repeat-containing protein [Anaerolineae bacterium]|nr:right-handed parallel beta-helix repeat-containing protein [Anaerolineae bacterium]